MCLTLGDGQRRWGWCYRWYDLGWRCLHFGDGGRVDARRSWRCPGGRARRRWLRRSGVGGAWCGCCSSRLLGSLFGQRGLQASCHRGLDAGRGSLDVFAHFLERLKGVFRVDAEFGGDFVNAWFGSHFSPVWVCTRTGADHYVRTVLISSRSLVVHRSISLFVEEPRTRRRLLREFDRWPAERKRATHDRRSCVRWISQRIRRWDEPTRPGREVMRTDPVPPRHPRRRPSAKWICRRANGSPSKFLQAPLYPLDQVTG